ncbi:MAG: hypothetical protein JWP29_1152 [Rhodoferax sp.]|nr:hypothetical protein [Rhodoferax sp.]
MFDSATSARQVVAAARIRTARLPSRALAIATFAVAATAVLGTSASAAEPQGLTVYVEGGKSAKTDGRATDTATIGLRIPTQTSFWGGSLSLAFDVYASQWRSDEVAGTRTQFTQLGVVPMFRYRFDAGQSPWFIDAGVGVSWLDGHYRRGNEEFSTEWNFSDHLGVGRNFGADNRHELGVYVKHVSNASIKSPNPGETFYQLRYGYRF